MHVKVGDDVIWESTHPENGFTQYSAIFTATSSHETLKFENDSPEGDRSVFIDTVQIFSTRNALEVVLPPSSADKIPFDFQLLSTPLTWVEAEKECERRNRKLASIHSMKENNFVAGLAPW